MLVIMDGFGLNHETDFDDAIKQAAHPTFNRLFAEPYARLWTHGRCVGLPDGQMGGSEVGHLTIGAGRVCPQTLVRVDDLCDGAVSTHPEYLAMLEYIRTHNNRLHLFSVLSDGGVHSHIRHLQSLLKILPESIEIQLHIVPDGRDTPSQSLPTYLELLKNEIQSGRIHLSTLCGRYFTFDRANNWDRIERAYQVMTQTDRENCPASAEIPQILAKRYSAWVMDEHHEPIAFSDGMWITDGDAVWCLNFRADRCREITQAFTQDGFSWFNRTKLDIFYLATFRYYPEYTSHFLLDELDIEDTLPEAISKAGKTQLHVSETDKFIHVTKFFAGLRSEPFAGQTNKGFVSYTGGPFAEKPEMEADEMCAYILENAAQYDFTVVNFPNGDLVGHCGDLVACVLAVRKLGDVTERLIDYSKTHDVTLVVTADHGNCERMWTPENPDTAHTQYPVPCWIIQSGKCLKPAFLESDLTAIAPTVLEILGIEKPSCMTGNSLLS